MKMLQPDKNDLSNKEGAFELRLIVIAILLPFFFDTFPLFINQLPTGQTGFVLLLPQIISYIIGVIWFIVLMSGLLNLMQETKVTGKQYSFPRLFQSAVTLTILGIGYLINLYFGYLILISFGFTILLTVTLILLLIIVMLIYIKNKV